MRDIIYFSKSNTVFVLDQTLLPFKVHYVEAKNYKAIIKLIKNLSIRGAPAIGVAGSFGAFLALRGLTRRPRRELPEIVYNRLREIAAARPTAVNLMWSIKRFENIINLNIGKSWEYLSKLFYKEALKIFNEEKKVSLLISKFGSKLFTNNNKVLTHCNTGSLATTGPGTALGVIKAANKKNKGLQVFATETRPLLQGSRLTVWECEQDNVDCTLLTDSMASHIIREKKINFAIVGADRIAVNGDVANKIGTYQLAIACKYHKIPFFVAAPLSTFDFECPEGKMIEIEERSSEEILKISGKIVSIASKVVNPAFDVTPNKLISGIITEKGIIMNPNKKKIIKFKDY
ncbi:S-methyl-5-thioribose-1-phosphate isomerase [bacterium]|nr:S-methyl-5-thioribose-1-phosphate isomerase [bacterium]